MEIYFPYQPPCPTFHTSSPTPYLLPCGSIPTNLSISTAALPPALSLRLSNNSLSFALNASSPAFTISPHLVHISTRSGTVKPVHLGTNRLATRAFPAASTSLKNGSHPMGLFLALAQSSMSTHNLAATRARRRIHVAVLSGTLNSAVSLAARLVCPSLVRAKMVSLTERPISEVAALAFCRLLDRWARGEPEPSTVPRREAALRRAAERAETALAGLERPLGRFLLELEPDGAAGDRDRGGAGRAAAQGCQQDAGRKKPA